MNAHTIGVAMSGGVDSTVTAGLLIEQGYSVHGFFMLLPLAGLEQQISKVQQITQRLQIPLHLVDLREQFSQTIISYFVDSYRQGMTPNPCVVCNLMIKCGQLMQVMTAKGMDKMATGHYARILLEDGRAVLHRAEDPVKDQSYFLCRLAAEQLEHLVLPLGDWKKTDVFQRAQEMGFSHFDDDESQDVCFMADQDLATFLEGRGVKSRHGEITTKDGQVLGNHGGIWKYTVGQRRGLGLPDATPWYVTNLDAGKNRVVIAKNEELFQHDVLLRDVQWAIPQPKAWQGRVQLRSTHRASAAQVLPVNNTRWQVRFDEPQRAITPGQFAVFYKDDQVIGSGIIDSTPVE
ncbi:MAG: tRNA 2-thiouridine(34) synthase MnmA [Thermodesulfobacteriota bacterium]|nr:tRNA 2-thiouridine(34) synthase MnmA [Thermodesulfobacteriota bacterium]